MREDYGNRWEHPDRSIEQVRAHIDYLYGCCWNGPKPEPSEFTKIVHLSVNFPSHDSTARGVIKMKGRKYFVFEESCDYTGHG